MPYTFSDKRIYVKDPDYSENYVSANVISEKTTAEQVAAIQAAGVAAGNAIDAKKDAALAVLTDASEMEDMQAGTFSTSTPYTTGQYVIQAVTIGSSTVNKLYRFTADHAAGAWTGTDVVEVKLANDVTDLKSALGYTDTVIDLSDYTVIQGIMQSNGQWGGYTSDSYQSVLVTDIPQKKLI